MEEIQYKAKLGQGRGLGLAELGNKAELDQLGLKLCLNWSLEDFHGWGGGVVVGVRKRWE